MGPGSGKRMFFLFYFFVRDGFIFPDRRVGGNCPAESFIWSAINLPSLSLRSFTPPAIYPSFPVAKGPCLFVALVICTNFLCNLFPSQPPTWSSRVRLLKVEPLIPASPLPPITPCLFPLPHGSHLLSFEVSLWFGGDATFASLLSCKVALPPLSNILLQLYILARLPFLFPSPLFPSLLPPSILPWLLSILLLSCVE